MKSPDKLYQFHTANLREIDHSVDRIARILRAAISQRDDATTSSFIRLYSLLLGAWAECRLRKLLYEPGGFDESERLIVINDNTQLEQWQSAIEVGFRRQYKVTKAPLSKESLPHSAFSRFLTLIEILNNDLRPIIELRNKLAHGQWVYPLNSEGNEIAQEQMNALRVENLLSLQFKKSMLKSLAGAIHDLVVSRPTFERDFDNHFRTIVETRRNLRNRDYNKYVRALQEKHHRGKQKRSISP